jgi:hypothetical protein
MQCAGLLICLSGFYRLISSTLISLADSATPAIVIVTNSFLNRVDCLLVSVLLSPVLLFCYQCLRLMPIQQITCFGSGTPVTIVFDHIWCRTPHLVILARYLWFRCLSRFCQRVACFGSGTPAIVYRLPLTVSCLLRHCRLTQY